MLCVVKVVLTFENFFLVMFLNNLHRVSSWVAWCLRHQGPGCDPPPDTMSYISAGCWWHETLIGVVLYLVSMLGQVKDPTYGVNVLHGMESEDFIIL